MTMASEQQVKKYLAHWFQLGKKVLLRNGREALLPQPVMQENNYSWAFEKCWQRIMASDSGDCYLEGTHQSVRELLTSSWEITPCARCSMPVPMIRLGVQQGPCPCNDLGNWPNTEIPSPRHPVDSAAHIKKICQRLDRNREEN